MTNYGCRDGMPHDLHPLRETPTAKWEVCHICSRKFRWTKGFKGRIANPDYLKAHVRNYAQPGGATRKIYNKIYHPERCIIKI